MGLSNKECNGVEGYQPSRKLWKASYVYMANGRIQKLVVIINEGAYKVSYYIAVVVLWGFSFLWQYFLCQNWCFPNNFRHWSLFFLYLTAAWWILTCISSVYTCQLPLEVECAHLLPLSPPSSSWTHVILKNKASYHPLYCINTILYCHLNSSSWKRIKEQAYYLLKDILKIYIKWIKKFPICI